MLIRAFLKTSFQLIKDICLNTWIVSFLTIPWSRIHASIMHISCSMTQLFVPIFLCHNCFNTDRPASYNLLIQDFLHLEYVWYIRDTQYILVQWMCGVFFLQLVRHFRLILSQIDLYQTCRRAVILWLEQQKMKAFKWLLMVRQNICFYAQVREQWVMAKPSSRTLIWPKISPFYQERS